MGSARLKIKIELNYRKGPTWKNCGDCNHFVNEYEVPGCPGPRCKIIGLNHSAKYRIRPDHICDRHDNSERLKRLGVKI